MKIILDTNVLVSGLLTPFGKPGEIVRMIAAGFLQLYFDARIITEYRNVLKREKFQLDREYVNILLEHIESRGELIISEPLQSHLPDKEDEPFIEIAIASRAKYLVTGNIKHYPVNKCQNIKIVTPAEFLNEYRCFSL